MLTLTPNATETIERILALPEIPEGAGIRISPTNPMMNGSDAGQLALTVAEQPDVGDQVIEQEGARVFVEDAVAAYLDEMRLDADVVDDEVRFMLAGPDDLPAPDDAPA